jgi:transposase
MMIRTYKTGASREQPSLLPPCIDDYVARDNMVRAIDCYVGTLDLAGLGFVLAGSEGGPGQPAYHPGDLLFTATFNAFAPRARLGRRRRVISR